MSLLKVRQAASNLIVASKYSSTVIPYQSQSQMVAGSRNYDRDCLVNGELSASTRVSPLVKQACSIKQGITPFGSWRYTTVPEVHTAWPIASSGDTRPPDIDSDCRIIETMLFLSNRWQHIPVYNGLRSVLTMTFSKACTLMRYSASKTHWQQAVPCGRQPVSNWCHVSLFVASKPEGSRKSRNEASACRGRRYPLIAVQVVATMYPSQVKVS